MDTDIRINEKRLWDGLMEMACHGATKKGGVCRLALSDADRAARDLFVKWCKDAGCGIRIDPIGNIFARRAGRDPGLPPVMTGSHLDTQPAGGKFDGAYGVLAGLEIVRTLNDNALETGAPLEIVVWTNEEGVRFSPPMFGSEVFAGKAALDAALMATDKDSFSVGGELSRIGYDGTGDVRPYSVGAYIEAHIEQGPLLEASGKRIGIVTGVQGLRWFDVVFSGQDAHAGTTPMDGRKDALAAAVKLLQYMYDLAGERFNPDGRATAGELILSPGSRNTIPGKVTLRVDIRHPDDAALSRMGKAFCDTAMAIGEKSGVGTDVEQVAYAAPITFDKGCVSGVAHAAHMLGYDAMKMVSGAGHDAVAMSRVTPTAMVFVPCLNGISHNASESATPQDLSAGCNVLMHAILDRAGM